MLKVLGLGNLLRGDDSIGPLVIEKLQKLNLAAPVTLYDIGMDAFTIMEHLLGSVPLLIIDCAKMGKKPGEIVKFRLKDNNLKYIDSIITLHSIGLSEIYQMAKSIGSVADCNIIGVEPKSIDFNSKMSLEVKGSVPKIIEMVIKEAKHYAKKDLNN
jgi:hydrogenase maturation protease